jgi:hypothetical protein
MMKSQTAPQIVSTRAALLSPALGAEGHKKGRQNE